MTPEGKIKTAIKKVLDSIGSDCYYFMPVQTGMGSRTVDYLICFRGKFFGIEAKKPKGKATPLQSLAMRKITKAGGDTIVINSLEQIFHLREWLEKHAEGNDGNDG